MVDRLLVGLLAETHDHVGRCAGDIRFNISDEVERHLVGYLATMLEVSAGCVALADAKKYVGIPILARTFYEAFVDAKMLLTDAAYIHSIVLEEEKGWIRLLQESERGNPYLHGLSEHFDVPTEIGRREAENERRKELGGRKWTAKERWSQVGLHDEYEAIFRTLSAEAHNDGRAISGRHFLVDGDMARMVVYREDPPWVESVMLNLPRMLYRVGVEVGTRFSVLAFEKKALEARMDHALRCAVDEQ